MEWLGAIVSFPTSDQDDEMPEGVFWMGADGALLGAQAFPRGEAVASACTNLAYTMEAPESGDPHRPTRVRVASPELADALRAGFPKLEVVCAPTPELDAVIAGMHEAFERHRTDAETFALAGLGHEAVSTFFATAAALYRAKPWKVVPSDQHVFEVSIPALDLHGGVLSVIGARDESLGFLFFPKPEHFEAFLEVGEFASDMPPTFPPHVALSFGPSSQITPEQLEEIEEHGWEIAGPEAYPTLFVVDSQGVPRTADLGELTTMEVIARALCVAVAEPKVLRAAWEDGERVVFGAKVTHAPGEVVLNLTAPYVPPTLEVDRSRNPIAELAKVRGADGHLDDRKRRALEDELTRRFYASPEAQTLGDLRITPIVFDLGAKYLDETIATIHGPELREILFELFPQKVALDPEDAPLVIAELRAFYTFARRELRFEHADECLRALGDDTVERLRVALSDPRKFGFGKSMLTGHEAVDLSSPDAVAKWLSSLEGMPIDDFVSSLPGAKNTATQAAKAKKSKRKTTRKARRKNR
ncbi:MAG: hypothetical protein KC586_02215 [Myxococcales bacterium]|nr:hypothetical protein [Myxococcales bacterium]